MSGLRDEVTKRILRASKPSGDPLSTQNVSSPVITSLDGDETRVPTDPREGKQFGAYRILRRLGSGGMGQVYLALDTRLGRHAALKFLSPDLLADSEALQRLEQEARTASALNHPNILTIYEVGQHAGEFFIASEFVEGITLKKAVEKKLVDPDMAIRVVTQVASALMAAHAAGVIHRDLKPANVMVRPDGYVKVIDFGLAKVTKESRVTAGGPLSFAGSVVGTVDYMSPEQARGDEVDSRTDLWSLGVLLYEMLSNRRPFFGETDSHVIVAILDRPVPTLPNLASLPSGVGRVVMRALIKDPAKRYQSAEEMLQDLEKIDTSSARRRLGRPLIEPQNSARRRTLFISGIALVTLACALGWWWLADGEKFFLGPDWFHVDSVKQLTFNGHTQLSAISPDGKYLAFVVGDEGGMQSLHVKQVDQPSDEMRIPSRAISYEGLTFSPDSRTIYETEKDETTETGRLFAVPVVGERPLSAIVEDIDGEVAFAPAGDRFAFVRHIPASRPGQRARSVFEVAKVDGTGVNAVFDSDSVVAMRHIGWSPDGKKLVGILPDSPPASDQMMLGFFDLQSRRLEKRASGWGGIGQLAWGHDGRSLILTSSSKAEGRSRSQIRQLAIHGNERRDVTKDLSGYASLSLTSDGRRIAAVKIDPRATLWISEVNDFAHGRSAFSELQDNPSLAWLDGEHLLINSRRTGYPNLAVFQTSNQTESNLTNGPFREQHAERVSGRDSVVYSSNRSGTFHIWRYDRPTNKYTQLTFGSTYDDTPSVSPDGKWVVYTAWSSTSPSLYKIPIDGGAPTPIGNFFADNPQISPDGKWVACQVEESPDHWVVAIVPFDGGPGMRPLPKAADPFRWSNDSQSLTSAITDAAGVSNIWQIPLDGGLPKRLTQFEDETILTFAWSLDNTRLACVRLQNYSDVMLFERQKLP
jgi:eukaryotic-like serine/threonine-protein kinase